MEEDQHAANVRKQEIHVCVCVLANEQVMHIHTGCIISYLFPSQHTSTLHKVISTAMLKKKKASSTEVTSVSLK